MPRIFISDKLEAGGIDLVKISGLDIDNRPGLKDAALQEALQAADGMIVRNGTQASPLRCWKIRANCARIVPCAGVGVDNIGVAAATPARASSAHEHPRREHG